jgi:hypothetical protein
MTIISNYVIILGNATVVQIWKYSKESYAHKSYSDLPGFQHDSLWYPLFSHFTSEGYKVNIL